MSFQKIVLSLLFTGALAGTARASAPVDACGKDDVQFKVKTDKKQSAMSAPEPGKAQIVFIESLDGAFMTAPTARFAIDGTWVGADRGASYFAVSVDPGEHHVCARRQTSEKTESTLAGLVSQRFEPGTVYYIDLRVQRNETGAATMQAGASLPGQYPGSMSAKPHPTVDTLELKVLTADEGRARLNRLPVSTFVAK